MTFPPVVERELRVAARRPLTQWLRFIAAALVMAVAAAILMGEHRSMSPPQVGRMLFTAMSILAFAFALLAGMFLTADCLCSEKREGTLGLLFLTDLKGYDVVVEKLAATSMVAVYAMIAIIPMLGLPLLMGGVSGGEFGRMVVALLSTLLLSLAAGMFASAICRDTRTAMLVCFGQMLLLTGVVFLVALVVARVFGNAQLGYLLLLPGPLFPFLYSSDTSMALRMGPTHFWVSVGIIGGLALAQLIVASLWLPRSWQEQDLQPKARARAKRARRLSGRLALNPFFWLATRERFPGTPARIFLGVLFVGWFGIYMAATMHPRGVGGAELLLVTLIMAYGLHLLGKGLVAVQASRRMSEDRRSGALELLLVTPLAPETIIDGHWQALRRQFIVILALLWTVNVALLLLFLVVDPLDMPSEIQWTFGAFFAGGAILLPADFSALGWVGLAEGLSGKRHHRAVLSALGLVMAPPLIVVFLFIFLSIGSGVSTEGMNVFYFFLVCFSLVVSRSVSRARRNLLHLHFRPLASGDRISARNQVAHQLSLLPVAAEQRGLS